MASRALEGIGVLLVEDEAMVRNVLRRRLVQLGANVHEAGGVSAACALLVDGSLKIDVVLTEEDLPGLSGGDLVEWLRVNRAGTPVIVLSASAKTGDQLRDAIAEVVAQTRPTTRIPRLSRPRAP
jgi:CheY-like chemotaxis protein